MIQITYKYHTLALNDLYWLFVVWYLSQHCTWSTVSHFMHRSRAISHRLRIFVESVPWRCYDEDHRNGPYNHVVRNIHSRCWRRFQNVIHDANYKFQLRFWPNPLAHWSEYSRRSHGLWPEKATFLDLIISDKIFKKHRSNFNSDTTFKYWNLICYNTIIVKCKMNRYFE